MRRSDVLVNFAKTKRLTGKNSSLKQRILGRTKLGKAVRGAALLGLAGGGIAAGMALSGRSSGTNATSPVTSKPSSQKVDKTPKAPRKIRRGKLKVDDFNYKTGGDRMFAPDKDLRLKKKISNAKLTRNKSIIKRAKNSALVRKRLRAIDDSFTLPGQIPQRISRGTDRINKNLKELRNPSLTPEEYKSNELARTLMGNKKSYQQELDVRRKLNKEDISWEKV